MSALVEAILSLTPASSAEEWLRLLGEFNVQNQNEHTFCDRFGEKKKTLLEVLSGHLTKSPESWNADIRTAALCTIRLCCREAYGLEPISAPEFVGTLFEISNLISTPEGKIYSENEQSEAAKGLVNLAMRDTAAFEKAFLERNGLKSIIENLKNPATPTSLRFPFSRLVFLLALNETICDQFIEQRTISIFTQILTESLVDLEKSENIVNASEAMKAIFKLSMTFGPLSEQSKMQGQGRLPTPEELEEFKTLIPQLLKVLNLPTTPNYMPLKEAVVNCLINIPAACTELFPQEETLSALINILHVQVTVDFNPAAALTPILLVLTSIATAIPRARSILKKVVFPHYEEVANSISVEPPKVNLETNTIGSKLIAHMTTFNVALKHYVNEFLFVLCDQDPNELVKMTGFGNAAGLLATHNLFKALGGGSQATEVKMPAPRVPAGEELSKEVDESVSGSESSFKTGKPMGFLDSMTEEEKEAEAERLGLLMEKLEAQGIIKVFRNDDPNSGGNGSSTSSGSS